MGFGKAAVAVVGTGSLAYAALNHFVFTEDDPQVENTATILRVIDGDTVEVDKGDGVGTRVRLLNVDTPEIGRNGEPSECLAEDAKSFLEETLPPGTEVRLEHDAEIHDPYDRELAGIFKGDLLVNEAITARGLADAKIFNGNDRFYPQVKAAADSAKSKSLGVFDVPADCLIRNPEARQDFQNAQRAAQQSGAADGAVTVSAVNIAGKFLDDLPEIRSSLKAAVSTHLLSDFYTSREPERLNIEVDRIEGDLDELERDYKRLLKDYKDEKDNDVPELKEPPEPGSTSDLDALFNDLESPSDDSAYVPAPAPVPRPAPQPQPQPAPAPTAGGGGGYDGYTGCRAYGGNYAMTNTDDKGRPYAKIDCVTKAQIG